MESKETQNKNWFKQHPVLFVVLGFAVFYVVAVAVEDTDSNSQKATMGFADASTRVRGYYKPSTGSYVAPHYRSSPNSTRYDNYSTKGNSNPYTGKKGSTSPYKPYRR